FLIAFGSFSFASADSLRLTVGASGNLGMLSADGEEHSFIARNAAGSRNQIEKKTQDIAFGTAQIFGELSMPFHNQLRVGVSYVPYTISTDTTESVYNSFEDCPNPGPVCNTNTSTAQNGRGTGEADITQKVQVDLNDMTTFYVSYVHESGPFIKAGIVQADLITNEVLQTNSKYGNTTLDGYTASIGYEHALSNGLFIRGAADYTQFDTIALSSTGVGANQNKVVIKNLSGPSGTLSIGKNF
ncbi:hypothetical protein N8698_03185, partial [Candidatus Pelagibacter sp.]|nr:hypothetical protein [Candidatus Pelagibacter sp.]